VPVAVVIGLHSLFGTQDSPEYLLLLMFIGYEFLAQIKKYSTLFVLFNKIAKCLNYPPIRMDCRTSAIIYLLAVLSFEFVDILIFR